MKQEERFEIEQKTLERTDAWIGSSDTKIQITLAFIVALPAFLVAKAPELRLIIIENGDLISFLIIFSIFVHFFFLSLSLYHSFRTLVPDIKSRKTKSLLFFGSIASIPLENYSKKMLGAELNVLENDLVEQIHSVSVIANNKFKNVTKTLQYFFIAMTAWLFIFAVWLFGRLF